MASVGRKFNQPCAADAGDQRGWKREPGRHAKGSKEKNRTKMVACRENANTPLADPRQLAMLAGKDGHRRCNEGVPNIQTTQTPPPASIQPKPIHQQPLAVSREVDRGASNITRHARSPLSRYLFKEPGLVALFSSKRKIESF